MALQFSALLSGKQRISVDLRIVLVVLLVVIGAVLFIWKPWAPPLNDDRTVRVTGEATVTASPDEFVFYPSYEFTNADKAAALAAMTQKSDDVIKQLKSLGVADNDIKTSSSGYDYPLIYPKETGSPTYTLQVTVTTHDLALAQKVQDYLITTAPTGNVTPQATFSVRKRKELETQARNDAAKDARTKADEMAKNIGFDVVKVKAISDDQGFGGGMRPFVDGAEPADGSATTRSQTVQPGENDLNYSVAVEYYIN